MIFIGIILILTIKYISAVIFVILFILKPITTQICTMIKNFNTSSKQENDITSNESQDIKNNFDESSDDSIYKKLF